MPEKWDTIAFVTRNSAEFKDLTLTQLHGRLLTYERELNQKRKLQESGKVADDYSFAAQLYLVKKNLVAAVRIRVMITLLT